MKKLFTAAALIMALAACSGQQTDTADPVNISSLGQSAITDTRPADAMPLYPKRGESIERDFIHQPPMIPHKADYKITMKRNGCMSCHSWDKAKKRKATPIDVSHVKDNEGTLNNHYYSCTQCHTPQAENKQQLVENSFSNK
ncbi:MAG: cytochrome c-type protein NapB [Shewanella sp.]|jgi:cytochrome c-type protein NapB